MAFIGYDPTRLQALRRAVHDLVDEQTAIRSDDPWGREPATRIRDELARIASWTFRIDQILSGAFTLPYRPVTLGDSVRAASSLPSSPALDLRLWAEWLVALDPTTAFSSDLAQLAAELPGWLTKTAMSEIVNDHDRARRLIELFDHIAADPAAAEAFAKALGPDGLSWVSRELAGLLSAAPPPSAKEPPDARLQDEAGLLNSFAEVISAAARTGHLDATVLLGPLINQDAYAAISLVRWMTLPAAQLGELANTIWARASTLTDDQRGLELLVAPGAPTTVELMIDLFARQPDVGRSALTTMGDEAYVALLEQGRGATLGRMFANVTAPAAYPKQSSSAIVGRLLSTLDRDSGLRSPELVGYVGVVAGPWLPELVVVEDHSSGYPLVPLDVDGGSAWHVLTWIAANKQAAQSLAIWMSAIGEIETARIVSDPKTWDQFEHLGVILGGAADLIRLARVHDAQHQLDDRRAVWGTLTSTISNVITAAEVFEGPVGLAANLALTWVAQTAADHAFSDRLGNGIVDATRVEQIRKAMSLEVSTMASIASAMYERLVAEHRPPLDREAVPPPPRPDGVAAMAMTDHAYRDALRCWRKALPAAYQNVVSPLMTAVSDEWGGFNNRMALGEHVKDGPKADETSTTDETSTQCPQNTPAGS